MNKGDHCDQQKKGRKPWSWNCQYLLNEEAFGEKQPPTRIQQYLLDVTMFWSIVDKAQIGMATHSIMTVGDCRFFENCVVVIVIEEFVVMCCEEEEFRLC
jgi:hypothetical protein